MPRVKPNRVTISTLTAELNTLGSKNRALEVERNTCATALEKRNAQLSGLLDEKTQLARELDQRPTMTLFNELRSHREALVGELNTVRAALREAQEELRWIARHAIAKAVNATSTFDNNPVQDSTSFSATERR